MEPLQVHCVHCGQTFLSTNVGTCTLCGKSGGIVTDPDDPLFLRELTLKKNEADQIQRIRHGLALCAALLFLALGISCLLLLALEGTEANEDVAWFVGVPCLLVGGFIFLMVSLFRRRHVD